MKFDTDLDWTEVVDNGFNSFIGPIRFADCGDHWLGALVLQPHHLNKGGVCHGGVYMALADTTMGIAAHRVSDHQPAATIDFQTHFLAAAKLGQELICKARLNRAISGLVFMEGELWSGERKCARTNGIWKQLSSGVKPAA